LIPWYNFWTKAKTIEISFTIHNAKFFNGSKEVASPDALRKAAQEIQNDIEKNLTKETSKEGKKIIIGVVFESPIEVISDLKNVETRAGKSDNLFYVADIDIVRELTKKYWAVAGAKLGENLMILDIDEGHLRNIGKSSNGTVSHEFLHELGLDHNEKNSNSILFPENREGQKIQFEDAKKLVPNNINNKEIRNTLQEIKELKAKEK
jgi:hypothetical protein